MPGTPPTTTHYAIPRYDGDDPADFPTQYNAGVDRIDTAVWSSLQRPAWIDFPFNGSWQNSTDAQYGPAKYRKDALGYVELKGVLEFPAAGSFGSCGLLPAGYRPLKAIWVPASLLDFTANTADVIPLVIDPIIGQVVLGSAVTIGHGYRVFVDAVRFPTD